MTAAERARLNSVRRPFVLDQSIPMLDLSLLFAHLFVGDSIGLMIKSNVVSLFVWMLLSEIALFNQFLGADDD